MCINNNNNNDVRYSMPRLFPYALCLARRRQYFTFPLSARTFVPFPPLHSNDFLLERSVLLDSIKCSNTKLILQPYAGPKRQRERETG